MAMMIEQMDVTSAVPAMVSSSHLGQPAVAGMRMMHFGTFQGGLLGVRGAHVNPAGRWNRCGGRLVYPRIV